MLSYIFEATPLSSGAPAYVGWIRRFILFHGKRHPAELGAEEIAQFLSNLAERRKVSATTQTQALSALLFLYRRVLDIELPWIDKIVHAKRPVRLPVVLTPGEIAAVLAQLDGVYWTIASLLYGSGLRPMECLRLRVKDLDFDAHQITVRDGKSAKDRVTVLARQSMQPLRSHLQRKLEHHRRDLLRGSGETYLPVALARKCPRAAREWPWQFVFPARSDVFWRWLERGIKRP